MRHDPARAGRRRDRARRRDPVPPRTRKTTIRRLDSWVGRGSAGRSVREPLAGRHGVRRARGRRCLKCSGARPADGEHRAGPPRPGSGGGVRLVYGGHSIGLAFHHVCQALPSLVTVAGWHGCDHLAPVHEGDLLTSSVVVDSAQDLHGWAEGTLPPRDLVRRGHGRAVVAPRRHRGVRPQRP